VADGQGYGLGVISMPRVLLSVLVCLSLSAAPVAVAGKAPHTGWPHRDGALIMHKLDQSGPIYGFPYLHNELLGGHGNDNIYAGDAGDVIWGDYKPSGQPTTQSDVLQGGAGRDFIYASHGHNVIDTGAGNDVVHGHFGYGSITCHSPQTTVFLSHKGRKGWTLQGCQRISYKTFGHH
jgi:Ca2+-binding RTX toxin-like protein